MLFFAGYFPPLSLSTASVRTWNIAAGLARKGWAVTVVTPRPELWRPEHVSDVVTVLRRAEASGIRLLHTGHALKWLANSRVRAWDTGIGWLIGGSLRRLAQWSRVDTWIGWTGSAVLALTRPRKAQVDVVLASGPPHAASFLAAAAAATWFRVPFALDYRDLWTGDPHVDNDSWLNRKLERRLLRSCSGVTVVSPSIGEWLDAHFGVGRKTSVVTNGYDPEDIDAVPGQVFDHFAIVYAGLVAPPIRSLKPLFELLSRLEMVSGMPNDWRFHYYGMSDDVVEQETAECHLQGRVVLHGRVPKAEAVAAVKGASLVVVVTSCGARADLAERGIVTGKLFEVIGARRPYLVIAPPESDTRAIVEAAGGGIVVSAMEGEEVIRALRQVMSGGLYPSYRSPETFSWPYLACRYDELLRNVVACGGS